MATDKTQRITDLRRNLQKKSIPFHNVFTSMEGKQVLDALKAEFDPPELCAKTAHETTVRAAQRDVIAYIDTLIALREEEFK